MKWLLYLYPKAWRKRYGDEFSYILENKKLSFVEIIDIFVNAADTRLLLLGKGIVYMKNKLKNFMNESYWKAFMVVAFVISASFIGGYWLSNSVPSILQLSPKILLLIGVGMGFFIGYLLGVVRGILRVVKTTEKEDIFLPTGRLKFDKSSI